MRPAKASQSADTRSVSIRQLTTYPEAPKLMQSRTKSGSECMFKKLTLVRDRNALGACT